MGAPPWAFLSRIKRPSPTRKPLIRFNNFLDCSCNVRAFANHHGIAGLVGGRIADPKDCQLRRSFADYTPSNHAPSDSSDSLTSWIGPTVLDASAAIHRS